MEATEERPDADAAIGASHFVRVGEALPFHAPILNVRPNKVWRISLARCVRQALVA